VKSAPITIPSFLVALLALSSTLIAGEQKRGITAEDYYSFATGGDPHISPDGKWVAYTVTRVDQAGNRRMSRIWMVATDGTKNPQPLTAEGASSTSPRWSPDGKYLGFLSTRDGSKAQVWLLPMAGGEAARLTNFDGGISNIEWSPDSSKLLGLVRTGPEPSGKSDVRHYTHIKYKLNDSGFFDDLRTHIVVVDVKTRAVHKITSGDEWNDKDPHWAPDSERIVFVSDRSGKEFDFAENENVWVTPASGGVVEKVTAQPGTYVSPAWSPDGKHIAYLGETDAEDIPLLYVTSGIGKPEAPAARDLDQPVNELTWAEDGRALYFYSPVRGETHMFRYDLATSRATPMTAGARAVKNFTLHEASQTMAYLANDFEHLDDLWVRDISGGPERQLTHLNADLWTGLRTASVEPMSYKAQDGWEIQGFLVKPLGWEPGKKYPMALSIHGGPSGMYGVDWYHEFQVYAARGWAVFFVNPRGSTGYGRKFQRGVALEWGGKAYTDIMTGVDEVLKRNPWIDTDRLGVTGGSYGGFMTNWIVTQTNRFKAAVTLRSVSNFVSDEGTRDYAYLHDRDFGGDLYHAYDLFWKYSPIRLADKVKTPTLVLHSENDQRVPIEQGEQWFRALQHFGVTSEFVIFPRENHNLTRTGEPKHLVESLNWQCYWFERFLDGNSLAKRPTE
jgi:dipeptidyl aminopeptidase/acylaminoacyl peptidase